MKIYSMEKKLDQVKESVRICKFNIRNQQKKLEESTKKITTIKNKIASISSPTLNELEELVNIDNKLMIHANLQKGLILELEGELNLYENKLQQLKTNSINKDL